MMRCRGTFTVPSATLSTLAIPLLLTPIEASLATSHSLWLSVLGLIKFSCPVSCHRGERYEALNTEDKRNGAARRGMVPPNQATASGSSPHSKEKASQRCRPRRSVSCRAHPVAASITERVTGSTAALFQLPGHKHGQGITGINLLWSGGCRHCSRGVGLPGTTRGGCRRTARACRARPDLHRSRDQRLPAGRVLSSTLYQLNGLPHAPSLPMVGAGVSCVVCLASHRARDHSDRDYSR